MVYILSRITISVDDGCQSDLRLSELCLKYGFDLIIYLPVEWHSLAYFKGYKPLSYDQAKYLADIHEIGSHGITHRHLTQIPEHEAKYEIETSKDMLEDLLDVDITKFAAPRGYTNDLLTEFTLKFYEKQRLTREPGLVHIHPDSGANDNKPWQEAITPDTKEIFCHSWELDRFDLWNELEDFFERNRTTS